MATADIHTIVADMGRDERFAFARGLIWCYSLANDMLSAELNRGGDLATIAAVRQRLTEQWEAVPGAYIDELSAGGVRA